MAADRDDLIALLDEHRYTKLAGGVYRRADTRDIADVVLAAGFRRATPLAAPAPSAMATTTRDVWLFKAVRENRSSLSGNEATADVEICETREQIVAAVWRDVMGGRDGDPEHAREVDAIVDELLGSGSFTFEGDPPLELERVSLATTPAAPATTGEDAERVAAGYDTRDREILKRVFREAHHRWGFDVRTLDAIVAAARATPLAAPVAVTEAMLLAAMEAFNGGDNPYGLKLNDYAGFFRDGMRAAIGAALSARQAP